MAGHSQFKNIMHKKGKQDAIRSKLFSKLAREITVAAKMGLPDPNMNARLRAAVLAARAENMPKDNIERAIKKASGADAENYDEVRYEGYAPGGVAVIVEALTDNRNRTAGEVRSYFTKAGGSLAETGAVSFMFDRVGLVEFDKKAATEDAMMEAAIDAGAEDVSTTDETHEVITSVESLRDVAKALAIAGVLNMGRTRLFKKLSDELHWIYRDGASWTPYQTQIATGRLTVKLGMQLNTRTGEQFATATVRITPKGAAKLAALLDAAPATVADALATTEETEAA